MMMKQTNNIPQGYKDSPLGIIPEEWEVKKFEDFAPLQRGFDLPIEKIVQGNIPVVFSNGILKYHNEAKAKAPGIVTGRSGTIGKVTYITEDYWPHNTSLWVTDFKSNLPKYIYYFIDFYDFIRFSSGSGVPTLNRNDIHKQLICIPPLPEQQKIAEILSVWDEAIEKQTQLIAQLETRKRGLMQQLLTGKKRLKGFVGGWKKIKIKEIAKEYSIKNKGNKNLTVLSCTKYNGLLPSLEYFGRRVFAEDVSTYKVVPNGYFAYATNHIEEGSIGYQNLFEEALISPMYTVFKTNDTVNDSFIYSILKSHRLIYQYNARMEGSIDRRGGLRWESFSSIKVSLPSIEEQNAIVQILSSADNEINLAKQKLATLKEQKKGLMQQLLTGKKRVKIKK